jgi:hypothetical protein
VSKQQHAVDRYNVNNCGPIYDCGDAMRLRDAVSRRLVSVLPWADVQMAATLVERSPAVGDHRIGDTECTSSSAGQLAAIDD